MRISSSSALYQSTPLIRAHSRPASFFIRTLKAKPTTFTLSQTRHIPICDSSAPKPFANRQSSLSLSALATGVIVSIAGLLVWKSYFDYAQTLDSDSLLHPDQETVETTSDVPWVRIYPGMPAAIPAGRPGNLTREQETKLRELWEALMNVCGSWPGKPTEDVEADRAPSPEEPGSGKKKHRLGGFLGRKKHHDNGDASSTDSGAEDKHGQTKEFKQALASQTPAELRETFWMFSKQDDPDAILLRFLRARKYNVHDALVMMVATMHWRGQVVHLDDDVIKRGEAGMVEAATKGSGQEKSLGEDFLAQMRMGKSFLHGTDRNGRPLCFVRVKLHKQGEQSEASLERYTVYTIETARFMLRPPVDTAVIVFDMTGFSMANMDYSPVKFMIKVFEANYPESLGHVLVHKSPWIFQGVWAIIKGWLDPVVASKVHFTKDAHELEQYIDPAHVPKGLGGQEDWEYAYEEPRAGENDRMKDVAGRQKLEKERAEVVRQYEAATVAWVRAEGDAEELQRTRLRLAEALRENYWRLDPFVRARTLYDRQGLIRQGGVIDMYPAEGKGVAAASAPPHVDGARERGHVGVGLGAKARESVDAQSVYYDARQDDVD